MALGEALFDWIFDHLVLAVAAFVALLICVIVCAVLADERSHQACISSGGQWVKTGETLFFHQVGKVPIHQTVPVYGCVHAEREAPCSRSSSLPTSDGKDPR